MGKNAYFHKIHQSVPRVEEQLSRIPSGGGPLGSCVTHPSHKRLEALPCISYIGRENHHDLSLILISFERTLTLLNPSSQGSGNHPATNPHIFVLYTTPIKDIVRSLLVSEIYEFIYSL